jgi:RNA polymerase sigma-70 factor (ECF subfamily)
MAEAAWLTERFERQRSRLRGVAYRMLGSRSEAEDAVQEAWLRLSQSDATAVENLAGWLTTVVARVCLDMLRSRKSRREEPLEPEAAGPATVPDARAVDPEEHAILADSIGVAMLVVLETLTPAERVAFVLHDMFGVPFDEVAATIGRSETAARQLASRARRRVRQGGDVHAADVAREREVVEAFLAASRSGQFEALLALLDPSAVLRADDVAVRAAAGRAAQGALPLAPEIHGAESVAHTFSGRAAAAQLALIDGAPGAVWAPGGVPRAAIRFTFAGDRIAAIDVLADADGLGRLELIVL